MIKYSNLKLTIEEHDFTKIYIINRGIPLSPHGI
jgi:hypothetical protein